MATERSLLDPFGLWGALAAQVDKLGTQATQTHLKSAEFSALMNKALAGSMTARKALNDAMRKYLEVMNLPSRDDVTALAGQLRALEDRLVEVSAALQRLDPAGTAAARGAVPIPPRTRKPPPELPPEVSAPKAEAATPPPAAEGPTRAPRKATAKRARAKREGA